ncbi:MAG: 3-oxoadipate enol-lactonase [Actinomycetota bacterium]|nr:3-oxoadipate enol-lactonase [Actinomycetota bacterium]
MTALHHDLSGPADAPVLVLAGSLGSTLAMWDPQVEALRDRFRVLRLDHRGHGGSPVPDGPYAIADLAGDTLELLDALGVERASFCGLSLGGMVGIWLGAHAPQRLSALVLCCTTARMPDVAPWGDRIRAVRAEGTASIADAVVEGWFTPGWAAAHPDVVAQSVAMIADTSDEGYAACCEAIAEWDGRDLLGRIEAPTLMLAAADDPATPVQPHAETIAAGIAGARLEVLDSAAHLATVERADAATALIADHVAAVVRS